MILMHRGSVRLEGEGFVFLNFIFAYIVWIMFAFESVCLGDSPK